MFNRVSTLILTSTLVMLAVSSVSLQAREVAQALPTVSLTAGGQTVSAEVASTDESRQKGLMFREKLARNAGMLFVFPELAYHAMWMRNTPLPLAVAFMDESGKIVSIHEMQPFNDTSHQAAGPVRYALEMNSGWFAQNLVKVGDTVKGLAKAPKPK